MSLSKLRNEISNLRSYSRNLNDESLGDYRWKRSLTQMLEELDKALKDMDDRISELEDHIEV